MLNLINEENLFTELFSLLRRYEDKSVSHLMLVYNSNKLYEINQYAGNAIDVLLQGLQGVYVTKPTISEQKTNDECNKLGFLISIIRNLTEALNDLKYDLEYVVES